MVDAHPFAQCQVNDLTIDERTYQYFSLPALGEERYAKLPYSIRVLLESAVRNCDNFNVKTADIETILNWKNSSEQSVETPFKPARVLLQDFTGVPAVVDLAAMRTAMQELGGDPNKINPLCQSDLVIDHSIQVDVARTDDAKDRNEEIEFNRNRERFAFLKWGEKAFTNFGIVPPGNGIVHQVNLEYLARVVFEKDGMLYPDSVVGTDSHTTMIDGLGVVIAAITSCTNTSNPSVMLQAGLLAKKAIAKGLKTKPYIWTSLSPGSGVVTKYFEASGVNTYLDQLGFTTAGYGCMTCIGNSGTLPQEVIDAIGEKDLVASAILSGNRNFEGRVSPNTRANYLASPPLVVAYALAGTVNINFDVEPVGIDSDGNPVMLTDIWPSRDEVAQVVGQVVTPALFTEFYSNTLTRNERWNNLEAPQGSLFSWTDDSTYIHHPPFFQGMPRECPTTVTPIQNARVLCLFGDSVTTDHISPAGNIAKTSAAAKFLAEAGVQPKDFNSYGARRGNDQVMARGTFANIRLVNKLVPRAGPTTMHFPSGEEMSIYDAGAKYQEAGTQTIILAGKEYGSGSSRDWAAKGPYLQGVKAVIAESYERIHRSNLLGMGILPLQFEDGVSASTLGFTGEESFNFELGETISVGQSITVTTSTGVTFTAKSRLDTDPEVAYFMNGGILRYVLRKLL